MLTHITPLSLYTHTTLHYHCLHHIAYINIPITHIYICLQYHLNFNTHIPSNIPSHLANPALYIHTYTHHPYTYIHQHTYIFTPYIHALLNPTPLNLDSDNRHIVGININLCECITLQIAKPEFHHQELILNSS